MGVQTITGRDKGEVRDMLRKLRGIQVELKAIRKEYEEARTESAALARRQSDEKKAAKR
jgi:hypothetical protein